MCYAIILINNSLLFQESVFQPPPHLLKTHRFELNDWNTYVYCGLLPESSGYGTVFVSPRLVVVHDKYWISLNLHELDTFFTSLRHAGPYDSIGFHAFDGNCENFYINGQCAVVKELPNCFNITFTDGEYEQATLIGIPENAIIKLLQLEGVLNGRLFSLRMSVQKVEGIINEAIISCRHNAAKIREISERWMTKRVEVEMAWLHFETFSLLVREFYEANKNNKAYF